MVRQPPCYHEHAAVPCLLVCMLRHCLSIAVVCESRRSCLRTRKVVRLFARPVYNPGVFGVSLRSNVRADGVDGCSFTHSLIHYYY